MKAFLKTYWLEFLFFAVGLVGAVIAMPFLPASVAAAVPRGRRHHPDGPQVGRCLSSRWCSCWCAMAFTGDWAAAGEASPALAHTLAGMERLLPAVLSIILLTLELCVLLAAWGVTVPVGTVMLIELLLVPIVFIGFVAAKILGNIGKLK